LTATKVRKDALERGVAALDSGFQVLPIQISTVGLEVRGAL
jgi:hypothetical protein